MFSSVFLGFSNASRSSPFVERPCRIEMVSTMHKANWNGLHIFEAQAGLNFERNLASRSLPRLLADGHMGT